MILAWSRILQISEGSIARRLGKEYGIKGKDIKGRIWLFFSENDVKEKCTDLLDDMPVIIKGGCIQKSEESYRTANGWSKILKINSITIRKRLGGAPRIKRRNRGKKASFFSERIVRERCADLLEEMPMAGEDGFFEKEEEKYGTKNVWATLLGISRTTLRQRLKNIKGIRAKNQSGTVAEFYSEKTVKKFCEDLLADNSLIGNAEGFFYRNEQRLGTVSAWIKELSTTDRKIRARLKDIEGLNGRTEKGFKTIFYTENIIQERCADLFGRKHT